MCDQQFLTSIYSPKQKISHAKLQFCTNPGDYKQKFTAAVAGLPGLGTATLVSGLVTGVFVGDMGCWASRESSALQQCPAAFPGLISAESKAAPN